MGTRATNTLRALLVVAGVALTAACGGGGGDSPPPPAAPLNNLGPSGGTVSSSDGKAKLTVAAGALTASANVTLTAAPPDANPAASPLFATGTSYQVESPNLSFASPAFIEITPAAGTTPGVVRPLSAVPPSYPKYSCNGSNGLIGPEWVVGTGPVYPFCPSGCEGVTTAVESVESVIGFNFPHKFTLCVPQETLIAVPTGLPCPTGYSKANFSALGNEFADAFPYAVDVCYPTNTIPPPLMSGGIDLPTSPITIAPGATTMVPCQLMVTFGTIGCPTSKLSRGKLHVYMDLVKPTNVTLSVGNGAGHGALPVTLNGSGEGAVGFRITGSDDKSVRGTAELYELKADTVNGPGGPQPKLTAVKLATVPRAIGLSDPKLFESQSNATLWPTVPFNLADPLNRYFFARVYDTMGNYTDSPIRKVTRIAPSVEVSSFIANPATLLVPGTATLAWSVGNATAVAIDQGVGDVTAQTVNGTGAIQVNVPATRTFTLTATGLGGVTATRTATVTIAPDTSAPTVSLSANPGTVSAPGTATLTATATDNVGVTQVEFYRGATLIGADNTPGDGFTQSVSFTTSDAGTASFTAKAIDAAGNTTTSAAATVLVTVPVAADRYVSPTGSDSNPGTQAHPYKTLTKAFAEVGASGTVWLANGTYTWADEVAAGASAGDQRTRPLPAGRTLRASTPGQATLNFGLIAQGAATVIGVNLTTVNGDTNHGYSTAIVLPNNAAVQLKGVTFGRFLNVMSYCNACGNATVSIDTNGVANFNYLASDFTGEFTNINTAHASGSVTVSGGRFSHPALASTGQTCNQGKFMSISGSAQFTLDGVAVELGPVSGGISSHPIAFCIAGGSAKLTLANGSTVTQAGSSSRYRAFALIGAGASLDLSNATVSGPFFGIVGTTGPAQVTIADSTLQGATEGITTNAGEYSEPTVTLTNSVLQNFTSNAINLPLGGTLSITGGQIKDNGGAGVRLGGVAAPGFYSGLYTLTVRNATIANNGNAQADGAGLLLNGAAGSVLDLGSAAQPGGNTILGLNSGKPGVRIGTTAGNTVNAVGNTWVASQQGASSTGTYSGNLVVTSGSGQNYAVTSGALRLSGN
jgi:hypothetical protein